MMFTLLVKKGVRVETYVGATAGLTDSAGATDDDVGLKRLAGAVVHISDIAGEGAVAGVVGDLGGGGSGQGEDNSALHLDLCVSLCVKSWCRYVQSV